MNAEFERRMQGKSDAYKLAMLKVARALAEWSQGDKQVDCVAPALEELQKVIDSENN